MHFKADSEAPVNAVLLGSSVEARRLLTLRPDDLGGPCAGCAGDPAGPCIIGVLYAGGGGVVTPAEAVVSHAPCCLAVVSCFARVSLKGALSFANVACFSPVNNRYLTHHFGNILRPNVDG